jgi:hypothetical protein
MTGHTAMVGISGEGQQEPAMIRKVKATIDGTAEGGER